jgi:hypothetical protein
MEESMMIAGDRRHGERQGKQDRNAISAPETWKHTDQHTEEDADEHVDDVHRISEDAEAVDQ